MAASVPAFPTSLANAGKMPALLEAGASRTPASRSPKMFIRTRAIPPGSAEPQLGEDQVTRQAGAWRSRKRLAALLFLMQSKIQNHQSSIINQSVPVTPDVPGTAKRRFCNGR
jgi:hypothetical protein